MKKIINIIIQLPKWCGIVVVLIYGLLVAEFMHTFAERLMNTEATGILRTLLQLNYVITILSTVAVWVILCLLFHLTSLLLNGKATFGRFLIIAGYPYIFPAIFVLIAISLLENVEIIETQDIVQTLQQNSQIQLIAKLVNLSFIPYYLIVACFVRHLYNIKWIYALLSIAIPVLSIWGIVELFKLI